MEAYYIHLNPSTVKKLENIAEKLDLSLQESFDKAMHFYLLHQLKSAHNQKIYVVFKQQNCSFDQLINDFWDFFFLDNYGKS
jgi:hypothetical protein